MLEKKERYIVIVHATSVLNDDVCGYCALISETSSRRKLIHGNINRKVAPAIAVYGELLAAKEALLYLKERNITSATIKLSREKALAAITGSESIKGCDEIAGWLNKNSEGYSYTLEDTIRTSVTYQMAEREAGVFNYKNGYKWNAVSEDISDTLRFVIQEFYTRKEHKEYEYTTIAYLSYQYIGPRHNVPLTPQQRREVELFTHNKEKRDQIGVFCRMGMLPKDALKCANILNTDTEAGLRGKLKSMAVSQNNKNRSGHLNDPDIENVVDRVLYGYNQGNYPMRTIEEAVLDEYLNVFSEVDIKEAKSDTAQRIYITGKNIPKQKIKRHCSCCGRDLETGYKCINPDIANILKRNRFENIFCSVECFAKAAGIKEIPA